MGTGSFVASVGGWDLRVALPDAELATRADAVRVLDAFAALLRASTQGRMTLGTVCFTVAPRGLLDADLVLVRSGGGDAKPGGLGVPGLAMTVGLYGHDANAPAAAEDVAATLLHEFGHYAFGLGDEYLERGPAGEIAACRSIMADTAFREFCGTGHDARAATSQNAMHNGRSCQAVMAQRFPVLRRPPPRATGATAAPVVRYVDALPIGVTLLAHAQSATPEVVSAVAAVSAVWTEVANALGARFLVHRPDDDDPMMLVARSLGDMQGSLDAEFGAQTRPAAAAIMLVGYLSSRATVAPAALAVMRGFGIPVYSIAPTDPGAPLRDFAYATGGACEVVVQTGVAAEVDLRARLLVRLAQCVEDLGVGLLHRATTTPGAELQQTLRVEPGARLAVLAVLSPAGLGAAVEVLDPSGRRVATQASPDASITWVVVASPVSGDWRVGVQAATAAPIACLGFVANPLVRCVPARPLSSYRPGQSIDLTATLLAPAATPVVHSQDMSLELPTLAALPEGASPTWNDGVSAVTGGFTTAQLQTSAAWLGYADCRIDYRLVQPGVEAVVRVLPFQLRVVARAPRRRGAR